MKTSQLILTLLFSGAMSVLSGAAVTIALLAHYDLLNLHEGIETRSLKIVDEAGNEQIALGSKDSLGTGIFVSDGSGRIRIDLVQSMEDRPTLRVYGESGGVRALIGQAEEGAVTIGILNEDALGGVMMAQANGVGTGVFVSDSEGQTRLAMMQSAEGDPKISVYDPSGSRRLGIGQLKGGESSIQVLDASQNIQMTLGSYSDGQPGLLFYDSAGKKRLATGLSDLGAHFLMANEQEDVQFVIAQKEKEGETSVNLYGPGSNQLSLGSTQDGRVISFRDERGIQLLLGQTERGPWVALFDTKGKMFWSTPFGTK